MLSLKFAVYFVVMNDQMLHSDVWIHVLSYISVLDACNSLQFVSKRFFYLRTLLQELTPSQLAAAPTAFECLHKLTRKPTLVLSFQQDGTDGTQSVVPTCVPDGAVVLGATASDVQSNIDGAVTTDPSVVMMLGFGPDTVVTPFFNELPDDSEDYDVMIVYACGHGYHYAEPFVSAFQANCPDATIVGGMCEGGFVSDDNHTLDGIRHVTSGIFGILGRNMPLRSVVSRGVKSLTDNVPWRVHEVKLVHPDDEEYIFVGHEDPYHCITKICKETVPPTSPTALLNTLSPDFCGLQRNDGNGFELHVTQSHFTTDQ